jgi:hypothetical protein
MYWACQLKVNALISLLTSLINLSVTCFLENVFRTVSAQFYKENLSKVGIKEDGD